MSSSENSLIESLPARERSRLIGVCKRVSLNFEEVLCEPGEPTRDVYFPIDGFISLIAAVEGSPGVEVGMIGREGMLGAQLALGVSTAPLHALVQGSGSAWRVEAKAFRAQLLLSDTLTSVLHRYVHILMLQLASSAACLRFHQIGPRLARWLLMTQDRAQADEFKITHEFMAYMLGVRRVGITAAAGSLQDAGLIEYHRGDLRVLDRPGLEAASCSCYETDRSSYAQLLK